MKQLSRTLAITTVLSCFAFGASAQQNHQMSAGNDQPAGEVQASYCDKPWAQVDGNSDGFVSREEASATVESRFGQIDADGNGEITKTEWVDCLSRLNDQTAAEADRDEQNFAAADANQDSELDRREFLEAAQQAFERTQAEAGDEENILVLRRYVFLTPEEGQDQSALANVTADEAAGRSALAFDALDQNDDDIIDTQEWSERSPRLKRDEQWASARFDELDADATGSISQEEYRTARQEMLDQMSTASTTADDSANGQSAGSSTGDASAQSGQSEGIPVYIFHFSDL